MEKELRDAFSKVINAIGYVKLDPALANKLQSMGLVKLEGDRYTPGCELYRLYFREYFKINENKNSSSRRDLRAT